MGDSNLKTVSWLAAYLGTSKQSVYWLISNDRIPGVVRLGPRSIRIDPETVKRWVREGGYQAVAS